MASWLEKSFYTRKTTITTKWGNNYFYPIGSTENLFGSTNYLNDFLEIPELNAILNIRARAMASGDIKIVSKATGKEAPANQSLVRVLRNPNWFQAQKEFWRQSSLWRDIYGNEYIYFLTPVGLANTFKGMFTLSPDQVVLKAKLDQPFYTYATGDHLKYYFIENGKKYELDKSNLIHMNDNRVQKDNPFIGTSKLKALQPALKNIRAAYKKRNIVLRMPVGILTNTTSGDAIGQAVPLDKAEKDLLQSNLATHGALPILTSLSVKYDDMQINASNMGLFEECKRDTEKICDAFGVPYEVLANEKGVTYANLKEGKKQMYEEAVIPDMDEKISALNMSLETDKKSWEVVVDFKHLPVFADDQKQRAISMKQSVDALSRALADGAITIEQYQTELRKYGI